MNSPFGSATAKKQHGWTVVRRFVRYAVDLPVIVTDADLNTISGHTADMSENGIGLFTSAELAIGQRFELTVYFPTDDNFCLTANAVVRDKRGQRYGAEFVDVPEHLRLDAFSRVQRLGSAITSTAPPTSDQELPMSVHHDEPAPAAGQSTTPKDSPSRAPAPNDDDLLEL